MKRSRLTGIATVFLAGILSAPAWGNTNPARPGTLNYIEGQAAIGGQALTPSSVGSTELQAGQSLTTQHGKAEMLLTPGVFVRLGDNSSVQLVSPGLANTELRVERGRAMVEVAEIYRANDLRVDQGGASIQITKRGLYDFDAERNQVRVFDGKAVVEEDGRKVDLKGGHALSLNVTDKVKAQGFEKNAYEDELYRWSSLRSSYLAEANVDAARTYVVGGPGWYGAGWYWDPWFSAYTFIPGDGFFYSPFGWGFYSPAFVYGAPFYRYGGYRRFGPYYRPPQAVGGFRSGGPVAPRATGGFSGGMGGGFRGGGGFHGGRR